MITYIFTIFSKNPPSKVTLLFMRLSW